LDRFDRWSIAHVPREINARADDLANEALDDAN
jgi:ribonuclease HI